MLEGRIDRFCAVAARGRMCRARGLRPHRRDIASIWLPREVFRVPAVITVRSPDELQTLSARAKGGLYCDAAQRTECVAAVLAPADCRDTLLTSPPEAAACRRGASAIARTWHCPVPNAATFPWCSHFLVAARNASLEESEPDRTTPACDPKTRGGHARPACYPHCARRSPCVLTCDKPRFDPAGLRVRQSAAQFLRHTSVSGARNRGRRSPETQAFRLA